MASPTEVAVGALQRAGIVVRGYGAWWSRSAGSFAPRGIMLHHDASPIGPSPGVRDWLATGASFAPASHFWVDMTGVWWVICNGRANHAGGNNFSWGAIEANSGNYRTFGVETDHTIHEVWPAPLYRSLVTGFRAICDTFGWDVDRSVISHKEYAPTRKIDPDGIYMPTFRGDVKAHAGPPPGEPAEEDEDEDMILIHNDPPSSPYLLSGGVLCQIKDGKTVAALKEAGIKETRWSAGDFKTAMRRYGR